MEAQCADYACRQWHAVDDECWAYEFYVNACVQKRVGAGAARGNDAGDASWTTAAFTPTLNPLAPILMRGESALDTAFPMDTLRENIRQLRLVPEDWRDFDIFHGVLDVAGLAAMYFPEVMFTHASSAVPLVHDCTTQLATPPIFLTLCERGRAPLDHFGALSLRVAGAVQLDGLEDKFFTLSTLVDIHRYLRKWARAFLKEDAGNDWAPVCAALLRQTTTLEFRGLPPAMTHGLSASPCIPLNHVIGAYPPNSPIQIGVKEAAARPPAPAAASTHLA